MPPAACVLSLRAPRSALLTPPLPRAVQLNQDKRGQGLIWGPAELPEGAWPGVGDIRPEE